MMLILFTLLWFVLSKISKPCFDFRKEIIIRNTLTEDAILQDVLIVVNTSRIFEEGKIFSCTNFGFSLAYLTSCRSGNDVFSEFLSYFVESSCNVSQTHFWITIPKIKREDSNMSVYMYYGKEMNSNLVENFSGKFITMDKSNSSGSACPNGLAEKQEDTFFPSSSNSDLSVGDTSGSDSHDHNLSSLNFTTDMSAQTWCACYAWDGFAASVRVVDNHFHKVDVNGRDASASTHVPPYVSLSFCENNSLDLYPTTIVMYLSDDIGGEMEIFQAMNNRFPRSTGINGITGIKGGSKSHFHQISGLPTKELSLGTDGSNLKVDPFMSGPSGGTKKNHIHSASFDTREETLNSPPHIKVVFAKFTVEANKEIKTSQQKMVFFSDSIPPKGFNKVELPENLFFLGTNNISEAGKILSTSSSFANHTHVLSEYSFFSTGAPDSSNQVSFTDYCGSLTYCSVVTKSHYHKIQVSNDDMIGYSGDIVPFNKKFLLIERKKSLETIVSDIEVDLRKRIYVSDVSVVIGTFVTFGILTLFYICCCFVTCCACICRNEYKKNMKRIVQEYEERANVRTIEIKPKINERPTKEIVNEYQNPFGETIIRETEQSNNNDDDETWNFNNYIPPSSEFINDNPFSQQREQMVNEMNKEENNQPIVPEFDSSFTSPQFEDNVY